MNAQEFGRKWAASRGRERADAQSHFNDICALLGERTPSEADPAGDFFAFEKGAPAAGRNGWADVWLKQHFAWEYKGKGLHKDLDAAYMQLQKYREALANPPLLVVCDFERYEVHTNWNTESWIYRFTHEQITESAHVEVVALSGAVPRDAPELTALEVLRALFADPDRLKPGRTAEQITRRAAALFEPITEELRDRWGVEDMRIARFVSRMVFCMFASDIGLLPTDTFSKLLADRAQDGNAAAFRADLAELFRVMNTGGRFWGQEVVRFNGQLFDDDDVPEQVHGQHTRQLAELDQLEWADVDPAIFGTLFERTIDKAQRKALGKHYTSRDDIELIVEPVLMAPLKRRWRVVQADALKAVQPRGARPMTEAQQREKVAPLVTAFLKELASVKVLDPACGSGNFLYVSLALLKKLEHDVMAFAYAYGVRLEPRVHPRQLYGIELNTYAHTLASVVIWIGYLQWKLQNGIELAGEQPVLEPLGQVEGRDAVLDLNLTPQPPLRKRRGGDGVSKSASQARVRRDPSLALRMTPPQTLRMTPPTDRMTPPKEALWPRVDVIVGNPPYIGVRKMRQQLGDEYVEKLWAVYEGRVDRRSDYVCYWFEKARAAIEQGRAGRAGLLATQAIRGGANRLVLERIKQTGGIFYAQADRKWILDGAAVRVSMVGFDDGSDKNPLLNADPDDDPREALGRALPVEGINANLTSSSDVTKARRLRENIGVCFQGPVVVGPFDIPAPLARKMLASPNPHGKPNSDVIFRFVNGSEIMKRPGSRYIIDFGQRSERDSALYEAPFEYVRTQVKPLRDKNRDRQRRERWWQHGRAGTDLREAIAGLSRVVATPEVAKHRAFVWLSAETRSANTTEIFARSDDYFFGVLQSRVHEVWARSTGTQLRESDSGFRYTPTTCFETFPMPHGTQDDQWAISLAAKELDDLRNGWLNPAGMLPAKELAQRTLTNLYNTRPTWLRDAHRALDAAVFAAYGWPEAPDTLGDAEIIARLLALNLTREPV